MSAGLIVTGFGPFHAAAANPSQEVIEFLARSPGYLPEGTRLQLLDVEYARVGAWLDSLLDKPPSALLLTGYSSAATGLTLERRATGSCSTDHPDNAGFVQPSEECAPLDNLLIDLDAIAERLEGQGLPVSISCDAGSFVCNYSYRWALAAIMRDALPTRALFVHLPAIEGTALAQTSAASMPLENLARGLSIIAAQMLGTR